jgi:ferritin-like metal-binding protein YciE
MADAKTILQKYVSDMLSLESHIFQAIDKQLKENKDNLEVSSKFEVYARTLENHISQLKVRLDQLGGATNAPIKEGVAAIFGVAAGVLDKFRSEEASKNLRDDYTALNLSLISYQMLHVTALALDDKETAELAARNIQDNADFVMEIQQLVPAVVLRELEQNHEVVVNKEAVTQTKELVSSIWK